MEWTNADGSVLRGIEDVKELALQLQSDAFRDAEAFHDIEIPILQSRRALCVAAEITDRADLRRVRIRRQADEASLLGIDRGGIAASIDNVGVDVTGGRRTGRDGLEHRAGRAD